MSEELLDVLRFQIAGVKRHVEEDSLCWLFVFVVPKGKGISEDRLKDAGGVATVLEAEVELEN